MENKKLSVRYFLKNPEYAIAASFLFVILISSMLQVLNRLIPQMKMPWTLELITYLFGGLVWIGIALSNSHARVGDQNCLFNVSKKVRKVI